MDIFRKEIVVFLKLWLLMLFSYLMIVLAFDLAYFGWIDLRPEAIARLIYLPVGQAVAFQILTYPKRREADTLVGKQDGSLGSMG